MMTAINTIITFLISTLLGYCLNALIKKTKNEKLQNKALMTLLKNNLVSTYFIYNEISKIPDYVYQNFLDELQVYESLDGNGFVHNIAKKMENWEIIKTNIL